MSELDSKEGVKLPGLIEETKMMIGKHPHPPTGLHEGSKKTDSLSINADLLPQNVSNWMEFRPEGKCPERRGFHASFIHNNCLYIHGGHDIREGTFSGFWRLDLSSDQYIWEKIEIKGIKKPGKIAYHTLSLIDSHTCILVGGSNLGVDNEQVFFLDLAKMEWRVDRDPKPDDLTSIDEHTACVYQGNLYIFGGNLNGFKSNKIFIYNLDSKKWSIKEHEDGIPPRSSHSAVVKDGFMYVFGGKDIENNKLRDFWKYDIENDKWSSIFIPENEGPLSRSGHSTGVYKDYIIIYAGIHELTQELCDMYLYNTKNGNWASMFEDVYSPVHQNRSMNSFSSVNKNSPMNSDANASAQKTHNPEKSGFSLSMKKTKIQTQKKTTSMNYSTNIPKKKLQKLIKKKRKEESQLNDQTLLSTPTSLSMQNSFLINSINKAYMDRLFKKNRKTASKNRGSFKSRFDPSVDLSPAKRQYGKVPRFNPKPRDGHTGIMLNEREYIVFGGDRHHMPFNDVSAIDLSLEI
ncbi:unnamed protein product [Moneuplotes crassus]|uniref:Uncharacterized protein n=2 Tax=Euplotes crassus TaxID=5936 RepID=A0AAD1UCP5_EUPCR|nr:unnamed protein product [Moneuplotes crassus]